MKQKLTGRLRVLLISMAVLLTGYMVVRACGGGDWEDGYDANIAPEAFVDTVYKPFFYSNLFYYDINYDEQHDERFNATNIADWSAFAGNGMSKAAISYLLTKAGYATIKATQAYYLGSGALPDSMKRFGAVFNPSSANEKAFIQYLTIAKACENFAAGNSRGYWDYEQPRPPKPVPTDVDANTIAQQMKQASTAFVKERYWFQLVRYNFFFDLPACIAAFENNQKDFKHSVMYYRAMAYAAGAYYKQKNYGKANYYYSLVFAGNDALKTVAHWSFHPQEEKDWQQTLAMCTSNKERITLWQMVGIFYSGEWRSIQEIYKLDPSDNSMDVLVSRLINVIETSGTPKKETLDEYYNWMKKAVAENKVSNPFLWNVSTGYLAYLKNDFAAAKQYYAAAEKKMPNTPLAKQQVRLIQLLNKVESLSKITAKDEQDILGEFQWLYHLSDSTAPAALRYTNAQQTIKNSMSLRYARQGDSVKAECFVSNAHFYASDKNINDLKAYLTKPNPTPFDVLCYDFSEKKMDDLWAYQSIKATYKDDLEQAIQLMSKAGPEAGIVLLGNPFNGKISDCHDCDHAQQQKVKYTKLAFLKKMKEMKDNVTGGKDVYNNALLLANGYYNASYFGNARYFYEGEVIGSSQSSPYDFDDAFKDMVTDNTLSTKYYRIALQQAKDDEQKAKCLYLLSKCQRNDWYNKVFYSDRKNDPSYGNSTNVDFITWNAFDALRKYKNTQYYRDVIQECGYFRTAMQR